MTDDNGHWSQEQMDEAIALQSLFEVCHEVKWRLGPHMNVEALTPERKAYFAAEKVQYAAYERLNVLMQEMAEVLIDD